MVLKWSPWNHRLQCNLPRLVHSCLNLSEIAQTCLELFKLVGFEMESLKKSPTSVQNSQSRPQSRTQSFYAEFNSAHSSSVSSLRHSPHIVDSKITNAIWNNSVNLVFLELRIGISKIKIEWIAYKSSHTKFGSIQLIVRLF